MVLLGPAWKGEGPEGSIRVGPRVEGADLRSEHPGGAWDGVGVEMRLQH